LPAGAQLKQIKLNGTAVTDDGIGAVAKLIHLEHIEVDNTAITKRGLLDLLEWSESLKRVEARDSPLRVRTTLSRSTGFRAPLFKTASLPLFVSPRIAEPSWSRTVVEPNRHATPRLRDVRDQIDLTKGHGREYEEGAEETHTSLLVSAILQEDLAPVPSSTKNCPACATTPLTRTRYEQLPVFACESCGGHLVSATRLEFIERRTDNPPEQLESEATVFNPSALDPGESTSASPPVSCPSCKTPMRREVRARSSDVDSGLAIEVEIDHCEGCSDVWLDPGELAMLQLLYEASPKGQNQKISQERYSQLQSDPERRARFERNFEKLPKGTASLLDAFGEEVQDGLSAALWSIWRSTTYY